MSQNFKKSMNVKHANKISQKYEHDKILIEFYKFWLFIHYWILKYCFHLIFTKLKFCRKLDLRNDAKKRKISTIPWVRSRTMTTTSGSVLRYKTLHLVHINAQRQSSRATILVPSGLLYQYRLLVLSQWSLIYRLTWIGAERKCRKNKRLCRYIFSKFYFARYTPLKPDSPTKFTLKQSNSLWASNLLCKEYV